MKTLLSITLIFLAFQLQAQLDSLLSQREQQLKIQLSQLRSASTDLEKEKLNQIFKSYLFETIQIKGAYEYPFSALKTIGTIKSPDNMFRFFNWNIEQEDHSNKYFCYILRFDIKSKAWKVTELKDNSIALAPMPDDILDENNWYGALYYKIIPIDKSGKKYYTILGLDANNSASNVKLVDVLSFSGNHIKLGSPIFKMQDGTHKRLFFEHSKKAYMSLNYDDNYKRIIYDHLSPESPDLVGFYEYYVPDLSYDELRFQNNKWYLQENVVGINGKASKNTQITYIDPKNPDKNKTQDIRNSWIDPSDLKAPGGANQHVAKLPGEEDLDGTIRNESKAKKTMDPLPITKSKNRKNEFSMNPFLRAKDRRKK